MKDVRFDTRPMRLLVAEDDLLAAEVLAVTAKKAGIGIETVANGLDAADRIAAAAPDHFDAVLLDMCMPILDGREAARRIRDLPYSRGTIPIFAMSSSEAELLRYPWATWLFDGHLTKPLRHSDFQALMCEHGRKLSGRCAKSAERDHLNAIAERLARGKQEIADAVGRSEYAEAGEAARRMRLCLQGLVPHHLTNALHAFEISQAHGRKESGALADLHQSIAAAKKALAAA